MQAPEFVPLFRDVIEHKGCTTMDAVIFGYVYWFTRLKNEKCTASNETIAELAGTTSGVVRNSLTALEKAKFITRRYKNDNHHSSRLEIIPLFYTRKVSPTDDSTCHPQMTEVSPTGAQSKSIKREHISSRTREDARSGSPLKEKKNNHMQKNRIGSYREDKHSDDNDDVIDLDSGEMVVAQPKKVRERKDVVALRLVKEFNARAKKYLKVDRISGRGDYFRALAAINAGLTEKQVCNLFDEWFDSNKKEEDLVSMAYALSDNSINKFKVANRV